MPAERRAGWITTYAYVNAIHVTVENFGRLDLDIIAAKDRSARFREL